MESLPSKKIIWVIIIFSLLHIFFINLSKAQMNAQVFGITLCGAEFGENNLPGKLDVDYTYPNTDDINYFAAKGVDVIQLPFKWERIQKTLGGKLDKTELSHILKFVDACAAKHIGVILTLQNFGRYSFNGVTSIVGGSVVTAEHLKDFWVKMAKVMHSKQNIFGFAIMIEPHDMGIYSWAKTAQIVISGIREVDIKTSILVDGDNYSNAEKWVLYNDDLKNLYDPFDKILFNAHCYFDEDGSGKYIKSYKKSGSNEMAGVNKVTPFVKWLQLNKKKGFIGEFGIPKRDSCWLRVMDNFLVYMQENSIGVCYWAAGSWWKDYQLSIHPINNKDQPQMNVLSRFFNKPLYEEPIVYMNVRK